MELFPINRYIEEDGGDVPSRDPSKLLKRLHKEAKRRRKALQLKESVENEAENEEEEEINETETSSKKKRKHVNENGISEDVINNDDEEIAPQKTKKKREKQSDVDELPKEESKTDHNEQRANKRKAKKNKKKDRAFMVIGEVPDEEKKTVKRVLPSWLAKPTVFSMDLRGRELVKVDSIGLCPSIVAQLRSNEITHFFPVQSSVISWLLDGFARNWMQQPDVCVSSPTGSGKTLAFVLPIIHSLSSRLVCSIKALIVLPVGDLATQVFEVFKTYSKGTYLRVGLAIGQRSFNEEQRSLVVKGKRGHHSQVDILVCTPGRLVDHMLHTPGFSLIDLRFLVIDEADRMMQQVKQDWLNIVEKNVLKGCAEFDGSVITVNRMSELRKMPQKLLFSATLSQNPEKLQEMKLFQPKLFTAVVANDHSRMNGVENGKEDDEFVTEFIGRYTTPKELKEFFVECDVNFKPLVILHFLHNLGFRHMFCFTNSVESSHRLFLLLSAYGGVRVEEFTSKLSAKQRTKALMCFTQGSIDVIVCSDTLARGMDVENVEYVVSYDLPYFLKSYIHRVGRTARAGRSGTAISLIEKKEMSAFHTMMETARKNVEPLPVDLKQLEPLEDQYTHALEQMKIKITEERSIQFKGHEKHKKIRKGKMNKTK